VAPIFYANVSHVTLFSNRRTPASEGLQRMPLICTRNARIFFAHVPKAGGSSIEGYLHERFGMSSVLDCNKRMKVRGTGLISPSTHLAAVDLAEMIPDDMDLLFTVVREPLSRMLSEYRYQTGSSRMSRMSFSTWLRVMIFAARRESRLYENHIRPQSDLVPEDFEIFKLEDGFDVLTARIDAAVGQTAPDLEVGHLLKRERKPIPVSREDAALVTAYFAVDYARFGYAQPDPSQYTSDAKAALRGTIAWPLAKSLVAWQRWNWVH
jgi:hypothetical protein